MHVDDLVHKVGNMDYEFLSIYSNALSKVTGIPSYKCMDNSLQNMVNMTMLKMVGTIYCHSPHTAAGLDIN